MTTIVFVFKNIESDDKTKYTIYSNSKGEVIINESYIVDVFKSVYTAVVSKTQKSLGKGSGWIIDSVIDHNTHISKYNPLAGNSYTELPKELSHQRKGMINIQNIGDECLKQCLVRYLNPADLSPSKNFKS